MLWFVIVIGLFAPDHRVVRLARRGGAEREVDAVLQ